MSAAREVLQTHFGADRAQFMTETLPGRIFRNEEVTLDPPLEFDVPQQRSLFGSLFRR